MREVLDSRIEIPVRKDGYELENEIVHSKNTEKLQNFIEFLKDTDNLAELIVRFNSGYHKQRAVVRDLNILKYLPSGIVPAVTIRPPKGKYLDVIGFTPDNRDNNSFNPVAQITDGQEITCGLNWKLNRDIRAVYIDTEAAAYRYIPLTSKDGKPDFEIVRFDTIQLG